MFVTKGNKIQTKKKAEPQHKDTFGSNELIGSNHYLQYERGPDTPTEGFGSFHQQYYIDGGYDGFSLANYN